MERLKIKYRARESEISCAHKFLLGNGSGNRTMNEMYQIVFFEWGIKRYVGKIARTEKDARKILELSERKGRKCFIEPAEPDFIDSLGGK